MNQLQTITICSQEFNLDRQNETFFATIKQISEIFETTRQNIESHIKNILNTNELSEYSVCKDFLLTASDGKNYNIKHYNLDMIIAVGYRVNSKKATEFRKQATKILKEYLTTGEVTRKIPTQIDSKFLLQIAEEMQKKENLITEQQNIITNQDNTIEQISNIQDTYSIREVSKRLLIQEKDLKAFLINKKWIQYLSDGGFTKKMYSTSCAKANDYAKDLIVFCKKQSRFFSHFRITTHGMNYLIKKRNQIIIDN